MSVRARKSKITDPYETLGVNRKASTDQVRAAFRRKAKKSHPDVGGNADEFSDLTEAMKILIDPVRRLAFDTNGFVEEEKPDDKVSTAMSIIDSMVQQIINDKQDPTKLDAVQTMKDFATNAIAQSQKAVRDLNKQIGKIEDIASRFRRRSGDNFIKRMLDHRAHAFRLQVADAERQQEYLRQVEILLEEYHFEFDQEPQQQTTLYLWMPMVMATGASTT